jgi:hypothetical protein
MRIAPDDPEKIFGFGSQFSVQVVRQAGVPFTSSNFSDRKTRWVHFGKIYAESDAQLAIGSAPALNVVWRVARAQAVRASLLANAQATTLECRRASMARTHSARRPDCRSSRIM